MEHSFPVYKFISTVIKIIILTTTIIIIIIVIVVIIKTGTFQGHHTNYQNGNKYKLKRPSYTWFVLFQHKYL